MNCTRSEPLIFFHRLFIVHPVRFFNEIASRTERVQEATSLLRCKLFSESI